MKPLLVGVMLVAMTLPTYAQGVCTVVTPPQSNFGHTSLPNGRVMGTLQNGEQIMIMDLSMFQEFAFVGGLFRRPDSSYDISAPVSRGWVARQYLRC
jgi:hypothetical protein